MKSFIYKRLIELTNGRITSSLIKKFAGSKSSKWIIPSFVDWYKINQDEMLLPLTEYNTLHDLFIRKLQAEARPIDQNDKSVVSPVDAVVEDMGEISEEAEIIVKNKKYSITDMLGKEEIKGKYIGGTFLVLYLSPSHYHRIHSPVDGMAVRQYSLGQKSYPVNKYGLKYGKEPLSKNFRKVTEIRTQAGHVAVVKVGAMFINSIEMVKDDNDWKKGEEVAYFSFGSTIVLLFEKGIFIPEENIRIPYDVRVGERIGKLK
ncbi:phosphatidylserine decarboxylase [Falsibacillus albus]|uniref:phosphatidylserine decarboxylase n=1 Tax=Falsibacillus albus TaxID=2478915 RepID=A0A3L7K6B7_9BACI|nr:phosphatidylserine decarboxylase [Falsibacillus albus]RLQ98145.1 phosphatidylserine decarboxylase [Falsibacillus albus]